MSENTNLITKTLSFQMRSQNLLHIRRMASTTSKVSFIDLTSDIWFFARTNVTDHVNGLRLVHHGEPYQLSGDVGIFFPPFNLVEFVVPKGRVEWETFISTEPVPKNLGSTPFLVNTNKMPKISSSKQLFEFIASKPRVTEIVRNPSPSPASERMKNLIDENYKNDISIEELSLILDRAHSYVSRAFKKDYGMTIVKYRTLLRMASSLGLIFCNNSLISDASREVGFKDVNAFNKQFLKKFRSSPSKLLSISKSFSEISNPST